MSITDPGHNHTQNAHSHLTTLGHNGGGTIYTDATSPYGTASQNHTFFNVGGAGSGPNSLPYDLTQSITATNNSNTTGITATNSTVQPSLGVTWFIKQ